jgi:hypothetical protein
MEISKTITIEIHTQPCPFCAAGESRHNLGTQEGEDEDEYIVTLHYVYCCDCGATGPKSKDKEHAILLWNRTIAQDD